mgnify:CR=1 FL=1
MEFAFIVSTTMQESSRVDMELPGLRFYWQLPIGVKSL